MKKFCLLAAFSVLIFALPFYSYSAEPKVFVSEDAPMEVVELVGSVMEATLNGDKPIATGKIAGVYDYWFKEFDTDKGVVQVLEEYACSRDEKGNLMPWKCDGETVAMVFVGQRVSWFKNLEVKKIFEEATK